MIRFHDVTLAYGTNPVLAIFRSLGARQSQLLRILVGDAFVVVLSGMVLGWLGAQALISALAPYFLETAGVRISPFQSLTDDLTIVDVLAASSLLIGLIPGWNAYRTDPVRHLQPS